MERKQRNARSTVFSWWNLLCIWGVVCLAFVTREYRISHPPGDPLHFDRLNNMSFANRSFYANKSELYRPSIGPLVVTSFKAGSKMHTRHWAAFMGTLIPAVTCFVMQLHGVENIVAFVCATLITLDPSSIIMSRSWNWTIVFWLIALIGIALLKLAEIERNKGLLVASALVIAISCVFDLGGFAVVLYSVVFIWRSKMGRKALCISLFLGSSILAFACDFLFQKKFLEPDYASARLVRSAKILGKRIRHPKDTWYIFLLWKFRPVVIWKFINMRIALVNNPVTIALSTILCGIMILKTESLFYFVTVLWTWVVQQKATPDRYQLALSFGVISVAKILNKWPVSWLFSILILALAAFAFIFLSVLTYAPKLDDKTFNAINIFNL